MGKRGAPAAARADGLHRDFPRTGQGARGMSGEGAQPQAIRKLAPGKLVIASHNEGKVREIGALLAPHGIETVSAKALGLPEPDETGTTFVANAELKIGRAHV